MTYSSGRVMISSKEEQTVIRQSRTGRLALLEEEAEEEVEEEVVGEWRRVNGRLKRVPNSMVGNSSTSNVSTTGEKVILQNAALHRQASLSVRILSYETEKGHIWQF